MSDRAELLSLREMLRGITRLVEDRIADGMDREQVVAAGLPDRRQAWTPDGIGHESFPGIVYDGLTGR